MVEKPEPQGITLRLLRLILKCQVVIPKYRAGYVVGKYVSIEKMIEQTKETYYEAVQNSSAYWREDKDDYIPFYSIRLAWWLPHTVSSLQE